jgi:hypothetical protein
MNLVLRFIAWLLGTAPAAPELPAAAREEQHDDQAAALARRFECRPCDKKLLENVPADKMRDQTSRGRHFALWLMGRRPEPVAGWFGPVEDPPAAGDRCGVCCSGGGIRSAAFNLGALQALQQDNGRLERADYVAAVSGGSYIAAAFATVARTWPKDPEAGTDPTPQPPKGQPGHDDSDPNLFKGPGRSPFYRGSPEEQYLRNRASYMAPNGLAKAFLALRLLLGLVWNIIFIGTLLVACGALAGYVYRENYDGLSGKTSDVPFDPPAVAWIVPVGLAALGLFCGFVYLVMRIKTEWARQTLQTWSLRLLIAGAAVAFLTVVVPLLLAALRAEPPVGGGGPPAGSEAAPQAGDPASLAFWTGLTTVIAGVLAQLRTRTDTVKEVAGQAKRARGFLEGLGKRLQITLVYAAAAVAVPLLALLAFTLSASWVTASRDPTTALLVGAGCALFFWAAYSWADLTSWSLHPFYKRRLATAFALKRVGQNPVQRKRGMAVERDFGNLPTIIDSDIAAPDKPWPVLVVCAAANISDVGATPPGRSVTSFTFSRGAIGGPLIGAVDPRNYKENEGDRSDRAARDINLLTAVAVSGAALSPSMGKETRGPVRALMALANVRLGVWMRNPRYIDELQRGRLTQRPRPRYLARELMGRNFVDDKFVYVTDGGHYENLGLVELLRRGCTTVYCFDASGGKTFKALGDAIALASSELGVDVKINTDALVPDKETDVAEADFAIGTITYPGELAAGRESVEGTLVYVRTVLTNDAPADVKAFHEDDELFPNHPTTDQLFTDQKFEAYRALGEGAATRACKALAATPDDDPGTSEPAPGVLVTSGNGNGNARRIEGTFVGQEMG